MSFLFMHFPLHFSSPFLVSGNFKMTLKITKRDLCIGGYYHDRAWRAHLA